MWLVVNLALIVLVVAMIAWSALRTAERAFLPGLVLISIGVLGTFLRELGAIPDDFLLQARILYLTIAIVGLVLVERAWRKRRKSRGTP